MHLFVSRKDTFNRDKVLQETVIIKGKRKEKNKNYKYIIHEHDAKEEKKEILPAFIILFLKDH